jgi:hypothetical protein
MASSINSTAFPFRGFVERRHLGARWWHRLLVVLFFASVLSVAVFSILLIVDDVSAARWGWRDETVFRYRSGLGEVEYGNSAVDFVFVPAMIPVIGPTPSDADLLDSESICDPPPSQACSTGPLPTFVLSSRVKDAEQGGSKIARPILFARNVWGDGRSSATYVSVEGVKDALSKGGTLASN